MRRQPLLWVAAVVACVGYAVLPASGETRPSPTPNLQTPVVQTKHLALNMEPRDHKKAASLGYNVFDMGPDADEINRLSAGQQAMIWVGDAECSSFKTSYEELTGIVRRFANNHKVFGYYLADEPNPVECPGLIPEIRRRADYIRAHAPGQRSFVASADYDYRPLRPANMHVDLIGVDPYPCTDNTGTCQFGTIDKLVKDAQAAGIPRDIVVPTFQTFGGECARNKGIRLPKENEMREILARWDRLVPNPVLDVTYSWGRQAEWACPTLADADGTHGHADLQSIMKAHNARNQGPPALPPNCIIPR